MITVAAPPIASSEIYTRTFSNLSTQQLFEFITQPKEWSRWPKRFYFHALAALFERRGTQACGYQEKLMLSWLHALSIPPFQLSFIRRENIEQNSRNTWLSLLRDCLKDNQGSLTHALACALLIKEIGPASQNNTIETTQSLFSLSQKKRSILSAKMLHVYLWKFSDKEISQLFHFFRNQDRGFFWIEPIEAISERCEALGLLRSNKRKISSDPLIDALSQIKSKNIYEQYEGWQSLQNITLSCDITLFPNLITNILPILPVENSNLFQFTHSFLKNMASRCNAKILSEIIAVLEPFLSQINRENLNSSIIILKIIGSHYPNILPSKIIKILLPSLKKDYSHDCAYAAIMEIVPHCVVTAFPQTVTDLSQFSALISQAELIKILILGKIALYCDDATLLIILNKIKTLSCCVDTCRIVGDIATRCAISELPGIVDYLMIALEYISNDMIVAEACRSLGKVVTRIDVSYLPHFEAFFLELLSNDNKNQIHAAICEALAPLLNRCLFGPDFMRLLFELSLSLTHGDADVRQAACKSFGIITLKCNVLASPFIIHVILPKIADEKGKVRSAAYVTLANIIPRCPLPAITKIMDAILILEDQYKTDHVVIIHDILDKVFLRYKAAKGLSTFINILMPYLALPSCYVPVNISDLLGKIALDCRTEKLPLLIEAVYPLLNNNNSTFRLSASNTLGNIALRCKPELLPVIIQNLLPVLNDRNENVLAVAYRSMFNGLIRAETDQVKEMLKNCTEITLENIVFKLFATTIHEDVKMYRCDNECPSI